jgi:hypothetical protein
MLRTAELDMANSVTLDDVDVFLDNAAWAMCSTYHTVLKASPGAAIFGRDMLFNISFMADWHKIREQRQSLTNCGNQHKNAKHIDYHYKVGDKVLLINEGILRKAESAYGKEPWTITTVHTNGTIRIQRGTKTEQLTSERQISNLAKLFLSADQINFYFIQIIDNIRQFCGIDKNLFFLLFF